LEFLCPAGIFGGPARQDADNGGCLGVHLLPEIVSGQTTLKIKILAHGTYPSLAISSSARARYSAPVSPPAGLPIMELLTASCFRVISVAKTDCGYCSRSVSVTAVATLVLSLNVRRMFTVERSGFSVMRTFPITPSSEERPCVAKYCVCTGIITWLLATSTLVSSSPRLGLQSIRM